MDCKEASELLSAYSDNELELARASALEQHLATCESCRGLLGQQKALGKALRSGATYYRTPHALRQKLHDTLPIQTRPRIAHGRGAWMRWGGALAAGLAIAIGLNVVWIGRQTQQQFTNELVADHVRSLMAGHLLDVASTDHHTVRPWFSGKLDFAPPVNDLAAAGFPLTGGRLDYIGGRSVAALVYSHGPHMINLFVWPAVSPAATQPKSDAVKGYNLVHWTRNGMDWWAVSDLNPVELNEFAAALVKLDG